LRAPRRNEATDDPPQQPVETDQQEAETEIFATSDTFASGILSAEDVLDS